MSNTAKPDPWTIDGYKAAVIELFKSGKATDEQWEQLGKAVLCASETECQLDIVAIDRAIFGCCPKCQRPFYYGPPSADGSMCENSHCYEMCFGATP